MFSKIDEKLFNIKTIQLMIFICFIFHPTQLFCVLNLKFYESGFVCEHACGKDIRTCSYPVPPLYIIS